MSTPVHFTLHCDGPLVRLYSDTSAARWAAGMAPSATREVVEIDTVTDLDGGTDSVAVTDCVGVLVLSPDGELVRDALAIKLVEGAEVDDGARECVPEPLAVGNGARVAVPVALAVGGNMATPPEIEIGLLPVASYLKIRTKVPT